MRDIILKSTILFMHDTYHARVLKSFLYTASHQVQTRMYAVDKTDVATQRAATEIVNMNLKITHTLQQWLNSCEITSDIPASSIPDDGIERMKQVDALLLVLGHTPKYTQALAVHGLGQNVANHK